MKKLITIILFSFSMQIFAQQYQVTKQKNVTLSKEQIDLENKKIEETKKEKSRAYYRAYSKEYRAKNIEKFREYERIKAREYRARKKLQATT